MKKQILSLLLALLLLFAACAKPVLNTDAKTITIVVTYEGKDETLTVETREGTLGAALQKAAIISGEDREYGLFIDTVNGHFADETKGEYWVFTKGGEWVTTGADTTPIEDGDTFEFFLYS